MRNFFKTSIREAGKGVVILAALGGIAAVAFAYNEPTGGPTGGTVYAPVNTGGTAQTKSGSLTVSGTLQGNSVITNSSFCLPGSNPTGGCITSWPSGGGSGQWAASGSNIYNTNGGNVGIGTANPQEKIDVNGNIYIGGNFYKAGNLAAVNSGISGWSTEGGVLTGFNSGRVVGIGQTTSGYAGMGISSGGTPLGAMYYDHYGNNISIASWGGRNIMLMPEGGGKVGIGLNPSQKLEVAGNIKAGRFYMGDNQYGTYSPGVGTDGWNVGVTTSGLFAVVNTWGGYQPVYASDYYVASRGQWVSQLFGGGGSGGQWQANGSSLYYNNGNVGIGTANPVQKLDVQGNINVGGSAIYMSNSGNYYYGDGSNLAARMTGDFYSQKPWGAFSNILANDYYIGAMNRWASQFSDIRLKENIEPLTDVADKILNIRGVSFEWNQLYDSLGHPDDKRHIGIIAQEMEAQFPELVDVSKNGGYKVIDYDGFTAVLVEAVKEQQKEIRSLKARINALEAR